MKFKLFLSLILIMTLLSCNHYLTPDAGQKTLLTVTYNDAKNIYAFMAQGNRSYTTYESTYISVGNSLDSLYNVDQKRNSNSALLVMDRALIKGWAERKGYHKGVGTMPSNKINVERLYMESYFQPRVVAENSIK